MPADLCRQCVGQVVAVQIERGDHVKLFRASQDLLKSDIGDGVLNQNPPTGQCRLLLGVGGLFSLLLLGALPL